jgi:hypothetical protein
MRTQRLLLVVLTIPLSACQRGPTPEEIEAATLAGVERALADAIQHADALAEDVSRTLEPMPLMTPGEEDALRRYLNDVHVARARALGVRAANEQAVDSLVAAGRLVQLEDSTAHWIVREGTSPAYVVPHTRALLVELGTRFQRRLAELDLPPYRIEVTSALRTSERQADLRESNSNAAAGASSHEFGTTVDLSYAAFAPPAELPANLTAGAPPGLSPYLRRIGALALESASARKSRELSTIFGEVLRGAQSDGLVVVIYERQQTVYHITVARAMGGA